MENSVRRLIQEIEDIRGEVVSVFGQPYRIPTETQDLEVDIVDVMQSWAGYEADLTISRLDYDLISTLECKIEDIESEIYYLSDDDKVKEVLEAELETLREELEDAEDNYIESEADSIEDYLDYLEEVYGIEEKYSGNTYNQGGNINHHYYEHHYSCGDGYHYVVLAAHRYGDVRCNYTDEVLLKFENEYEAYEVISENDKEYHTVDINGEEYEICVSARYEDIEVSKISGEYICTLYGNMTLEDARLEIANKLGIELVA